MTNTIEPTHFSYRARDGQNIAAYRWDPVDTARGVVQLTHGMGEHVRRYDAFAGALNARGFTVYGQDHRGHGASAATQDTLGQLGAQGWSELVNDINLLASHIQQRQPGLPLVLFGHSMGSFAVQQYLLDHGERVAAVALTGTAAIDLLEPALDLEAELDLAMFNAAFAPARTDYDWLSRDPDQVDAYIADPRCGFGLDKAAVKAMFAAARPLAEPARMAAIRSDLPLYVAVGEADPVNGNMALVNVLVERYRAAGLADVTLRCYPGARHEILNETNRAEVTEDLLRWLERVVPAPASAARAG